MLSEKEYDAVIHEWVGELYGTFEGQSAQPLPAELATDLREQLEHLTEPGLKAEERVAAAFAVVNQYLESTWPERVEEGYALYCDMRSDRAKS